MNKRELVLCGVIILLVIIIFIAIFSILRGWELLGKQRYETISAISAVITAFITLCVVGVVDPDNVSSSTPIIIIGGVASISVAISAVITAIITLFIATTNVFFIVVVIIVAVIIIIVNFAAIFVIISAGLDKDISTKFFLSTLAEALIIIITLLAIIFWPIITGQ